MKKLEFRKLRADEIDCRVNTINEKGITLLLYKYKFYINTNSLNIFCKIRIVFSFLLCSLQK